VEYQPAHGWHRFCRSVSYKTTEHHANEPSVMMTPQSGEKDEAGEESSKY
jgi:hypothetical protein